MRGVEGDVIPVVTLFSVRRIIGITVFLLFPHEGPFLVELHLAALVPFRVTQPSFYIYAAFCIKKSSWSAKPWSRIPQATAGTCRVVKCTRTKLCTIQ